MNQLELIQEAIEKAKAVLEDSQFARLHDSEGEEVKVKRPPKNPKEEKIDMPKDANKEMIKSAEEDYKESNPVLDADEEKESASRKKRLQERLDDVKEEMESYDSMKDGKSLGGYRRLLSERARLESSIEDIDEEIYKSVIIKGLHSLQHMIKNNENKILKSEVNSEIIKETYEKLETLADSISLDNKFADAYEISSKPVLHFLKENRL